MKDDIQILDYIVWKDKAVYLTGQFKTKTPVVEIVQDKKYASMWRLKYSNGKLSDMVNFIRAQDAAQYYAQSIITSLKRELRASK
jgi:hypothetical protein